MVAFETPLRRSRQFRCVNLKRGTGIINNELYLGRLVRNRLHYIKDPATGKRISRLNPESEWIVTEVRSFALLTTSFGRR
jgi:hypothetical protein